MVLAFRENDLKSIQKASRTLNIEMTKLLLEAGLTMNFFGNIYQNATDMNAFEQVKLVNLELSGEEFAIFVRKANRYGITIEHMLYQAVEMYQILNRLEAK